MNEIDEFVAEEPPRRAGRPVTFGQLLGVVIALGILIGVLGVAVWQVGGDVVQHERDRLDDRDARIRADRAREIKAAVDRANLRRLAAAQRRPISRARLIATFRWCVRSHRCTTAAATFVAAATRARERAGRQNGAPSDTRQPAGTAPRRGRPGSPGRPGPRGTPGSPGQQGPASGPSAPGLPPTPPANPAPPATPSIPLPSVPIPGLPPICAPVRVNCP